MAEVTTIDVTSLEGSDNFPVNVNDVYNLIETIASQNIRAVKSNNRIADGFYEYDVENGKVIEEAVIEMAQAQAFDKDAFAFTPSDPALRVRYFNNYNAVQFEATVRRNDIRKIIAARGVGLDAIVGEILDTLNQGEGFDDFKKMRTALFTASVADYNTEVLNGNPANMKGVIYAIRDAYNHLKATNGDLTAETFDSATPEEDIRIAITPKLLNLIDVVELANVFNLEKEALFGKIVVVDVDDLADTSNFYKVLVYDRKAFGRATRLYEYSQDISGRGLFTNHYLTVERAYFHNGLFKCAKIDATAAANAARGEIITPIEAADEPVVDPDEPVVDPDEPVVDPESPETPE